MTDMMTIEDQYFQIVDANVESSGEALGVVAALGESLFHCTCSSCFKW